MLKQKFDLPTNSFEFTRQSLNKSEQIPDFLSYQHCIKKLTSQNIASAGEDCAINIWQIRKTPLNKQNVVPRSEDNENEQDCTSNTKLLKKLLGHKSIIYHLILQAPDVLLSGAVKEIRAWNWQRGLCLRVFHTAHNDNVYQLLKIKDSVFASAGFDGVVKVWSLSNGRELMQLREEGQKGRVYSIVSLGRPFILAAACEDKVIRVWDTQQKMLTHKLSGHTDDVLSLVRLDAYHLMSGSKNGVVKIWDFNSGECVSTYRSGSLVMKWLKLNEELVAGACGNSIKIWEWKKDFALKKNLIGHCNLVYGLEKLNEKEIISSGYDKKMLIWQ